VGNCLRYFFKEWIEWLLQLLWLYDTSGAFHSTKTSGLRFWVFMWRMERYFPVGRTDPSHAIRLQVSSENTTVKKKYVTALFSRRIQESFSNGERNSRAVYSQGHDTKAVWNVAHVHSITLHPARSDENLVAFDLDVVINWVLSILFPGVTNWRITGCVAKKTTQRVPFTYHGSWWNVAQYSGWHYLTIKKEMILGLITL